MIEHENRKSKTYYRITDKGTIKLFECIESYATVIKLERENTKDK